MARRLKVDLCCGTSSPAFRKTVTFVLSFGNVFPILLRLAQGEGGDIGNQTLVSPFPLAWEISTCHWLSFLSPEYVSEDGLQKAAQEV